jgi:hypothetical protein
MLQGELFFSAAVLEYKHQRIPLCKQAGVPQLLKLSPDLRAGDLQRGGHGCERELWLESCSGKVSFDRLSLPAVSNVVNDPVLHNLPVNSTMQHWRASYWLIKRCAVAYCCMKRLHMQEWS